jgi:hypothetical protein
MVSKHSLTVLLLAILVISVGMPTVSAFTWEHTVNVNEKFILREFTMYPFKSEGYTWDPLYFECIKQWQSGPDYYEIKLKAIKCGDSTVVYHGITYNNYYHLNIKC